MHRDLDEARIVEAIRREGYAMVEQFVDGPDLRQLLREFDGLFAHGVPGVTPMKRHPSGPAVRLRWRRTATGQLPALRATFRSEALKRISAGILPEGSRFNEEIVATHDVRETPIADVHFDMQRALKFYLYLLDTDEGNGVLKYAPGSHRRNRRDRERFLWLGGRLRDVPNIPAEGERIPLRPLPGPAGTLLAFDTEGWHAAGTVGPGRERKILRAASVFAGQPTAEAKPLSWRWLRESWLNPVRPLARRVAPAGRRSTGGTARERP